ncbi:MAG: hypothetical protein ACW99Q_27330, partial [Candidatus Kariarchaeaceae archaeon]
LHIPDTYINPNNSAETKLFEDGDKIILRYNSPVNKTVQIGVEKLYFNKKPYEYDTFPIIAECLLINTNDTDAYDTFTTPYSYNISLQLTPFNTEHTGTYKDILIDLNLTQLQNFAVNGFINFSHIIFSVPNPGYELTLNGTGIIQSSLTTSAYLEESFNRIWQFTETEEFVSSPNPTKDGYILSLPTVPLFFNDADEGRWLQYLKIYDSNYNYYSAGISGDKYQLHYDPITGNFTWNEGFDIFQEFWGVQVELSPIIEPNTTLYFEYCTNMSWAAPIELDYQNIASVDIYYNYGDLLTPRYEEHYGIITENEDYDYELIQFYSESFSVYESANTDSYQFQVNYDFVQDFVNLSLYKIIGLFPNLTTVSIENDSINYEIDFDITNKNVTITDLISTNGLLNQFDLITIILNYSLGPVSTRSQLILSSQFNQTFLQDIENSFHDYVVCYFDYNIASPTGLFFESSKIITSDATLFTSIDFTRNPTLGPSGQLLLYNESAMYINYEVFEDPYHVMYVADIDSDGIPDYLQQIDTDRDGEFDVVMHGLNDRGVPRWHHRIIEQHDGPITENTFNPAGDENKWTDWFHVDTNNLEKKIQDKLGIEYRISYANAVIFARRSITKINEITTVRESSTYTVIFDEDGDGYKDNQVIYTKATELRDITVHVHEKTVISGTRHGEVYWYIGYDNFYTGEFPDSINPYLQQQYLDYSVLYQDV